MKAKIICYTFHEISASKRMSFHKEMYGYKDFSNKGKYIYQRKGVIDLIKHKKIIDGVIITDNEGVKVIRKTLKKYDAKIYVFVVSVLFKF